MASEVHADADYAISAKISSIPDVCVSLGKDSSVSWRSSQQLGVAILTTGETFVAQSEALKELLWHLEVTKIIGLNQMEPTPFNTANQAEITSGEEGHV